MGRVVLLCEVDGSCSVAVEVDGSCSVNGSSCSVAVRG